MKNYKRENTKRFFKGFEAYLWSNELILKDYYKKINWLYKSKKNFGLELMYLLFQNDKRVIWQLISKEH